MDEKQTRHVEFVTRILNSLPKLTSSDYNAVLTSLCACFVAFGYKLNVSKDTLQNMVARGYAQAVITPDSSLDLN